MIKDNPKIYNLFGFAVNNTIKSTAAKGFSQISIQDKRIANIANHCRYHIANYTTLPYCGVYTSIFPDADKENQLLLAIERLTLKALETISVTVFASFVDDYLRQLGQDPEHPQRALQVEHNSPLDTFACKRDIDLSACNDREILLLTLQARTKIDDFEIIADELLDLVTKLNARQKVLLTLLFRENWRYAKVRTILDTAKTASELKKALVEVKISDGTRELLDKIL